MSAISHYWLLVGRGRGAAKHLPMYKTDPQQGIIWPKLSIAPRNFTNHILTHLISHSTFSYTAQIFVCIPFAFYLSWNNKRYYTKNVHFLPSSTLKWVHKNSPVLLFFVKSMLIWQLSQYNLTKLFRMKLKTTKHY